MLSSLTPQISSHALAIEGLTNISSGPRFTLKKHHHTSFARGILEHTSRREQESHHVENKGGERKKRTLTVVPDVDG